MKIGLRLAPGVSEFLAAGHKQSKPPNNCLCLTEY